MSFQSLGILLKDCCRFDSQALLIRLGTFLWPMKSQSKFMSWWSVEINYLLLFSGQQKLVWKIAQIFFSSVVIIGWWTTDSENYHHPITSDKNNWDTFRNDTFWYVTSYSIYLHVLVLWYPQLPNSMLCMRRGVCSLGSIKINIV